MVCYMTCAKYIVLCKCSQKMLESTHLRKAKLLVPGTKFSWAKCFHVWPFQYEEDKMSISALGMLGNVESSPKNEFQSPDDSVGLSA